MKKYYMMHFTGIKEVDEKTYLKHTFPERDLITWYDDGNNIFFGDCSLDEKIVAFTILETTGKVELDYCLWGI